MKKLLLSAALALAALAGPSAAQNAPYRQADSATAPPFVLLCSNGADKAAIPSAVPCGTAANPVVVSGGTGGGGGGGGSAGSVTAAGTNGTTAQAVQGITGGIPQNTTAGQFNTPLPTLTNGSSTYLQTDASARLLLAPTSTVGVTGTVTTAGTASATGNVAGATADSGNPVKVGCVFNSTKPTYTAGQRTDCQSGATGNQGVFLGDPTSAQAASITAASGDSFSAVNTLPSLSYGYLYNGTTWDRQRSAAAATGTTGTGVQAHVLAPLTANVGVTPAVSTATGNVFKASAGNLYGYGFTQGATAGFLAILNATAVPAASGAITPLECIAVAAGASLRVRQDIPDRYTTGITFLSTSSCTTYTAVTPVLMQASVL